jgi:tRNA(Glu) U13 pseudouridine synthase TruD
MFGVSMRPALGEALAREERVRLRHGLDDAAQQRYARAGEGTRRPLRLQLADAALDRLDADAVRLAFFLPAGGYATIVLREIGKGDEREAGR